MADPRKANTLGEAAKNSDGTYDGFRALSWISEALHPGRGISEEDVRADYEKVKRERAVDNGAAIGEM